MEKLLGIDAGGGLLLMGWWLLSKNAVKSAVRKTADHERDKHFQ
jgi:hypothetical protein